MKKSLLTVMLFSLFIFTLGTPQIDAASNKTTIKYTNGSVYYVEIKNGKPHGKGTMTWPGEKSYSGEWVNGKRSGYGKYIANVSEDGIDTYTKYTGYWKNDVYNGQGEYVGITKLESDEQNIGTHIVNGTFTNGLSKKGYEFESNDLVYEFKYKDDKVNLYFSSYADDSDINKIFSKNFNSYVPYLEITRKQPNGLWKGYSYYLGIEADKQSLLEGYFNYHNGDSNFYTGVSYENDYEGYKISNIKNGKTVSTKLINDNVYEIIEQKLKKHINEITPYLKGFKKVYDRSNQEKTTFKQHKSTSTGYNITPVGGKKLKDYNGTWIINDLSYEWGDKPSGVIEEVTISAESDKGGTASITLSKIVDGSVNKSASVLDAKFSVDTNGVTSFNFDDDGYGHSGNVKIQFTNKGLNVECHSFDPEVILDDGTVETLVGGNWSLWEGGLEFPWSSKDVEVYQET